MTLDAPARRLLGLLVDEEVLETEPIAELRADLAALGLDPARAIAAVRRLAANAASPGVTLLGRIGEAEESDEEIRRLERADIASVRRNLEEGATATAIANAQRSAGGHSNVVGLRPRRSRRLLYGLCGVAAALAASLVLVVGMSGRQPFTTGHLQQPVAPTSTVSSQPAIDETDNLQARVAPAGNGPARLAEQQAAVPAAPSPSADAEAAARAKSEADDVKKKSDIATQPVAEMADAPSQTAATATAGAAGQASTEERPGQALANRTALPFGLNRPIAALLIVDPKLVPANLKQENYPAGDLLARLDDARRLAGERAVAALVTLQLADRTVDAVVVAGAAKQQDMLRRDLDKTVAPSAEPAAASGDYDVILLDRR